MNRRVWLQRHTAGFAGLLGGRGLAPGIVAFSDAGDAPALLPYPQSAAFGKRRIPLSDAGGLRVAIEISPEADEPAQAAARLIAGELRRRTGHGPAQRAAGRRGYVIRLSQFKASGAATETRVAGGYRLDVTARAAQIESRGTGFLNAAATFVQLLEEWERPRVREAKIADWPEFPSRGIYVEVTSGACMSLSDWRQLIDAAAQRKLNTIVVGLYNCWQRPSNTLDAEYFLFPSRLYPQFRTPIRTYVQRGGRWIEQTGLPPMYREDFLGELAAYGKAMGIAVVPYFSSLGHNTLLPRLMPEISMRDAACRPIGYGFCTSCPETYAVLFALYDEIIERYAHPCGITTFHVGMDEVAHACRCPTCRIAWRGENNFYVDHLIKICRHLRERGMTRVLAWHDMLHRSGLINPRLEARLTAAGLAGLITLSWWNYDTPRAGCLDPRGSFGRAFFRPQIGLGGWATPSAGWDATGLLGESHRAANLALYRLTFKARRRGASGVLSYSNHDPIFALGYMNLAQYAWNPAPDLQITQARYARWLFGAGGGARGAVALHAYQAAYDIYAAAMESFYRHPAPPRLGAAIAAMTGAGLKAGEFTATIERLAKSADALETLCAAAEDPAKAKLIAMYRVEVRRLASFLKMTLKILDCTAAYDSYRSRRDAGALAVFSQRLQGLRESVAEHRNLMRDLARTRFTPSLPRILPYEAQADRDARQFVQLFSKMERRVRHGENEFLPEITLGGENFFAAGLGMELS